MIKNLILKNRSYRRFDGDFPVKKNTLEELVDLARLSPSAANLQPLKYILSCKPKKNALIFPHLKWAGYLKDWPGPAEGERPPAYIVILGDSRVASSSGCDHGIAAQSILLGATEKGLGGCMVGSIDREALRKALGIPLYYDILLVIAIGKPGEKVIIETSRNKDDVRYWRDRALTHHVPKRKLNDIIIN